MRRIAKPVFLWIASFACVVFATLGTAQDLTAPRTPPLLQVSGAETPVVLRSVDIDTVVMGGLAQTTVEMVFFNPNARPLEGNLDFPLRDGQNVTGFALDFDGKLRPAVPVEKAKGRQVFEAIERKRVDPALLEQTAGNHFKLRIFPIPANGSRRVQLRYVESLPREGKGMRLSLPLGYAAGVEALSLRIAAQGLGGKPVAVGALGKVGFQREGRGWIADVRRASFKGSGELILSLPAAEGPQVYTQEFDGNIYFLAEVPVRETAAPRRVPQRMGLLWDSSASARKRDIASELAVLDAYFKAAGDIEVALVRLRDQADAAEDFSVRGGDWSALKKSLLATVYDGASNLSDWKPQAGIGEYLLFSDGLDNYGARSFPKVAANQRLYALHAAGANADGRRLRAWSEASGGNLIAIDASSLDAAKKALLEERPRLLSETLVGAEALAHESATPRNGMFRIAGRLRGNGGRLQLQYCDGQGRTQALEMPVDANQAAPSGPIAQLWAGYRIDGLSVDPETNRAAIRRLGQQFGMVTAETSLIVLETVQDYLTHDIVPPEELLAVYTELKSQQAKETADSEKERIDEVAAAFEQKIEWWNKDWPKGGLEKKKETLAVAAAAYAQAAPLASAPPAPMPAYDRAAPAAAAEGYAGASTLDSIQVTGARLSEPGIAESGKNGSNTGDIGIELQAWEPDSAYARRLRDAPEDRIYTLYLDERDSHANSTAFYLDVADLLFQKGQQALALRVLSNLAELDLENRHVLRVLAYRLMQAKQPALAVPVFEQVKRLGEEEPQSFRDLGLAYAAVGKSQAAIDQLYEVVKRQWDGRFDGVKLIALAELNDIAANAKQRPDTRRVDPRLLRNLPLDLRVVLSWDSDNSDMDLWVTDPNGEKCYYGNQRTYQGGLMSDDFTGGYGPEEFSLRDAKPGKYKVEANFFGDRQQLVTGATTLQLKLTTHFGSGKAREQLVTMRLKEQAETVLVGEFEVK
ncbi:VIT domain-containing protein [Pseudoxanthomonas sacheonensis]|uniref:VIT domain-containing protein n=1 Tax=Pseudoxanthomonas sacheonensis TaxID=443615 RepID=UPI0013D53FBA|nr:VIT domain-containing protein [Pseudoxanthomonas sacheonensis]KAF1711623.1 hypothetical protein CSC73_02415 [Pseudoxanthomonas sacheonensis]